MRKYVEIGPCPCNEEAIQVGCENYSVLAIEQCQQFIKCIRKRFGPEPEGAQLRIKSFAHDFGAYYEVVCYYDTNNEDAIDYADRCECSSPSHW